jgi:peptidyl-prolyl cis-trans isomerase C/foldase protein PrsA
MPDDRMEEIKSRVLEILLKNRLLLQSAKSEGISVPDEKVEKSLKDFKSYYPKQEDFENLLRLRGVTLEEFRKQRSEELKIEMLVDKITKERMNISPLDLKEYYKNHKQEFKHPEQVRVRQIVTDSEDKAQALREMLQNGASFEKVAKTYSLSPDRKQGGDLGWFGRGVMPREFDKTCFSLGEGELSPVVQTPYGFHLFEVLEKRGAGQFPFDAVREFIQRKLIEMKGREIFQNWYENLRAEAAIEVDTHALEGIR